MMGEGQIAALLQRIAGIDVQIAQLQQARGQSADPSERARLDAQIASLQETRQALEDELVDLQFPLEGASASI
jgi:predicted  nucleic acid-binding Zn-ribbon protein